LGYFLPINLALYSVEIHPTRTAAPVMKLPVYRPAKPLAADLFTF
jgi:hypothetical protein